MGAAKTSQSHPIQINPVAIRDGRGVIGLTFCPGKKHQGLYSGEWNRDLRTDLQAIQTFGAKALVTLMESEELEEVNVPAGLLAEWAREFGFEWHHLPVKDVHTPDERFEDLWTYSGLRLRSMLTRGEKVVIHCRGGLGRTGTVAGRLLVQFGDEPETAIQKIRAARPGSIETGAQEEYVRACKPIAFARVERSHEERALACLVGGAIGDALGYEVEFKNLREIRKRFGDGGIKTPVPHAGKLIVSDDTQMTLFTLEGLLRSLQGCAAWQESCTASIRDAYLDWLETQGAASDSEHRNALGWLAHQSEMRAQRAPGNTCLAALSAGGHGTIGQPMNESKGCGGAMRVAPIGLVGPAGESDAVFRLAAEAAALTHGHPSGYLSAGMVAALVRLLIDGVHLEPTTGGQHESGAIQDCCWILTSYQGHEETLTAVNRALAVAAEKAKDHSGAVEKLGAGWVGEEALAIALYSVLSANSFVEALVIAANHSGDSDSTASIAGQLWGAMNGLAGIPNDWIMALDVLHPLLHLSRQLILSRLR